MRYTTTLEEEGKTWTCTQSEEPHTWDDMHDTCVTRTRNASHTHTHAGSTASLFRRFLLSFFGDIFIYPFLSLSLSSVSLLGDTCRNTLYPLRNTRIQEIKKYKERTIQERNTSCNVNVNVKQLHVNHQLSIMSSNTKMISPCAKSWYIHPRPTTFTQS